MTCYGRNNQIAILLHFNQTPVVFSLSTDRQLADKYNNKIHYKKAEIDNIWQNVKCGDFFSIARRNAELKINSIGLNSIFISPIHYRAAYQLIGMIKEALIREAIRRSGKRWEQGFIPFR